MLYGIHLTLKILLLRQKLDRFENKFFVELFAVIHFCLFVFIFNVQQHENKRDRYQTEIIQSIWIRF